eukprot:6866302-Prymnesium_polylepis.1
MRLAPRAHATLSACNHCSPPRVRDPIVVRPTISPGASCDAQGLAAVYGARAQLSLPSSCERSCSMLTHVRRDRVQLTSSAMRCAPRPPRLTIGD